MRYGIILIDDYNKVLCEIVDYESIYQSIFVDRYKIGKIIDRYVDDDIKIEDGLIICPNGQMIRGTRKKDIIIKDKTEEEAVKIFRAL